jgi:c-di-GMP-binding flagellar brake protein YcgR
MGPIISQTELESLLETLARDQRVSLGVGDQKHRGWFRAQVVSHDAASGRLLLKCFMDRPTDRPLEPGQHVIVAANRLDDELQSAPMDVEQCSAGPESIVRLRIAGAWRPEAERRHQLRVPLRIRATRARRWAAGAWHDLEATLVDLSSRGVGVGLDEEVHLGDRLSLAVSLGDGQPDLRVTVELRHVRRDGAGSTHAWRAGGLFRSLAPPDHERIIRFIFAELRSPSTGSG